MIETPERFEAVADTLYGPAWGEDELCVQTG